MHSLRDRFLALLRWSERYTKTDMVYLTHGGFWLSFGQVISLASSFALAVAFANLLPPETYGTYRYVLSVAGILVIPSLTGVGSALTQAIARGYEGSYIPGLVMRLKWGTFGTLGSLGAAAYYLYFGNTTLAFAFALVAVFVPLVEISSMYGNFLTGRQLFGESVRLFLAVRAASVGALFLALIFSDNLFIILAAYFVPLTVAQSLAFFYSWKAYPPNADADAETLRYGVHISVNEIINQVSLYLDGVLLFLYLGPVGVAVYTFAIAPVKQIRGSYKSISTLALPKLATRTTRSINGLLSDRLWKLFGIGALIAGTYILAAPFVFRLFFSEYMASIFYSQLLAILLAFELPLVFFSTVVQSRLHDTPRSWLYLRNIPTGSLVLTALILTPLYGIMGVIISRFISLVASGAVLGTQWVLLVRREDPTIS